MDRTYRIVPLRTSEIDTGRAARWYHEKWGIPEELYVQSIEDCLKNPSGIPQWYLVMKGGDIAAGLGVIENDFHKRTDLAPNVCAVYVEKEHRGQKIAKEMMDYVCEDLVRLGFKEVYLLTDHTEFYEKCGWEFFCIVEENGGGTARMYRRVL